MSALAALVVLAIPACRLGSRLQEYAVLAANAADDRQAVAAQALRPGAGRQAVLEWPYGGSPSDTLEIVHDPLDRPAARLVAQGHTTASCDWLIGHYYACDVDY